MTKPAQATKAAPAKARTAKSTKAQGEAQVSNTSTPVAAPETPAAIFTQEQHGVVPPKREGKCMGVWRAAQALLEAGDMPTCKDVQAALPEDNATNVQIEYYRWRKWNGVRGRVAKVEAPATPAE